MQVLQIMCCPFRRHTQDYEQHIMFRQFLNHEQIILPRKAPFRRVRIVAALRKAAGNMLALWIPWWRRGSDRYWSSKWHTVRATISNIAFGLDDLRYTYIVTFRLRLPLKATQQSVLYFFHPHLNISFLWPSNEEKNEEGQELLW